MSPVIPFRRRKPPEIDLETLDRLYDEAGRELERLSAGHRHGKTWHARLRALGRSIASMAASFVLGITVALLSYRWVPGARGALVSVGPFKLLIGTEVTAVVTSIALSLLTVPKHARRFSSFLFFLVELNLIFALDGLI